MKELPDSVKQKIEEKITYLRERTYPSAKSIQEPIDKSLRYAMEFGYQLAKEETDAHTKELEDLVMKVQKEANERLADKDKLINVLDKIITMQWEFIKDVKKGQQGELKGEFINRIMKRANKLLQTQK